MDNVLKEYITSIASSLQAGQASGHEMCPLCKGGNARERSFVVRPIGGSAVHYKCYRVTCGMGSGILNGNHVFIADKPVKQFTPKEYKEDTRVLDNEELRFFSMKYELTKEELDANGVRRVPMRNSYMFPIYNHLGYQIGCVDRAYWGRTPKSISYWFKDDRKLHFPIGNKKGSTLLLVEDQVSAIKANRFMPTCALLGTSLSLDVAEYLSRLYPNVVIALDKDASSKAINYKIKFGLLFRNFNVVLLSKDIKDTLHVELEEILHEWQAK